MFIILFWLILKLILNCKSKTLNKYSDCWCHIKLKNVTLKLIKKPLIFCSCKEKSIVSKIFTPTILSTYILKLSFSVVNVSNNFKQTVKYMNKLVRVLI